MSKPDQTSPRQGNTLPRVKDDPSPRLPHEHDESASSQHSPRPHPEIEQAHADVTRGLVDTDRSPVTDEVYNRSLKQGHSKAGVDHPKEQSK